MCGYVYITCVSMYNMWICLYMCRYGMYMYICVDVFILECV